MNVMDSSGWLEYFANSANGEFFAPVIQNCAELLVPVICLYEVFKRVAVQRGEEEALKAAALMMTGLVVEVSADIALSAAQLSLEHKIPMADSLILATARHYDATVWTQDEHFSGLDKVMFITKPA